MRTPEPIVDMVRGYYDWASLSLGEGLEGYLAYHLCRAIPAKGKQVEKLVISIDDNCIYLPLIIITKIIHLLPSEFQQIISVFLFKW